MGGAVEMCSGLGVCRKKLEGTMCPSYMATLEEKHSTRGRANALRLAMTGRLGESGLGDEGVYETLDLCLECRACKSECPVGVDVARFKSEFLADYWSRHGTPLKVRMLGSAHELAKWGSAAAPLANWASKAAQSLLGIDSRRTLPTFSSRPLRSQVNAVPNADVLLFADTFTNYYEPEIGIAALRVLKAGGLEAGIASNGCCGRPLISKGLLARARERAKENVAKLGADAEAGKTFVFCEPSCLSAVREDAPSLLRGEDQRKAQVIAKACMLFEDFVEQNLHLQLEQKSTPILYHGHCHQKSMGLSAVAKSLLSRIGPVIDPDAGCCGMAGSFGYDHFEVSKQIAERRLVPAIRNAKPGTEVVATGFSCRHQIRDFTETTAVHPATLLASRLES
jgi:Fe-S oxidoreductase